MAEIIYCKLTETRSRRTWQILPKQYFPNKTPVYELAVSISQMILKQILDIKNTSKIEIRLLKK